MLMIIIIVLIHLPGHMVELQERLPGLLRYRAEPQMSLRLELKAVSRPYVLLVH